MDYLSIDLCCIEVVNKKVVTEKVKEKKNN